MTRTHWMPLAAVLAAPILALEEKLVPPLSAPPETASRADDTRRPQRDAAAPGHARMVATLAAIARRSAIDNLFVGVNDLPALRAQLEELPAERSKERWIVLVRIGLEELRLGNNEVAVASFREAAALHPELRGVVDPANLRRALFNYALASLRLAETRNCVARHTSESCILPIGKKGVHVDQDGSRNAIALLTELLAEAPQDLPARWLLNIASMTVGEWPEGLPEAYRIGPEAFASDEPFPRFVDVAPDLEVNTMTIAGGAIIDDFVGRDDVLDLVVSNMHPAGQIQIFQGNADGTFTERTRESGLMGITGGLNILQTDYNNDGLPDIFVPRGAWLLENGQIPCSLLRNEGDGTFTDVTYDAGLAGENFPSQTGAWADYDNDGDLDLYKGNEYSPRIAAHCQLFRNEGDGTFVDVARAAGVLNDRYTKGVVWGDFDGDRFPDLYVSNIAQRNRLYRNKGNGTFEDVAEKVGVQEPKNSFPVWTFDCDNDGALDILVSNYLPELDHYVRALVGKPAHKELPRLYKGDGKGGFRDVTAEAGLTDVHVIMSGNFGDLDHDGFLDLYLGTGFPQYEALMPNVAYWNRGGKRFADITTSGGFGHLQKGHGISFADIDRDGDQDVFSEMGGGYAGDVFGSALFRNPGGFGNHWITVKLTGTQSNRAGIGARIRCQVTEDGARRSIYRHVDSGGSFGANPLRQMIGLGKARKVDVLEVYWPTSNRTQVFRDVPVDGMVEITEGEAALQRVE